MRILGIETSTEYCSVALWLDGEVFEHCELVGQKHSERVMDMLDVLLKQHGVSLSQLDGIAFGKGPGSFTGVRIACGVTQGLALGANLPVFGVCTLEAVAESSGAERVIAALDARMSELYHAAYEKSGQGWRVICEPNLCKPNEAPLVTGEGWCGAGSGFAAHADVLAQHYAGYLQKVNAAAIPQAGAIVRLAAPRFMAGEGQDAALALPLYLRDKVALKTSEREKA